MMEANTKEATMSIVPLPTHRFGNFIMYPRIRQQLANLCLNVSKDERMVKVITKCEDNPEWGLYNNPIDGNEWSEYFPAYLFRGKKEGDMIELVYSDKSKIRREAVVLKITLQQQGSPYAHKGSFEEVLEQVGIFREK